MGVTPDTNSGQLLTTEELSDKCRLSVSAIHRLKREGRIPYLQPAGKGGRLLFPVDAIERACGMVSSTAQPPSETSDETEQPLSGPRPVWMQPKSPGN